MRSLNVTRERGSGQLSLYTPEYEPTGNEKAIIKTNKGNITIQLNGEDAPIHVANFIELANDGFYDNLKFHRHEPGFVIQGGCPNTREIEPSEVKLAGTSAMPGTQMPGTGGPGYTIKGEFSTNPNNRHIDGAVGMARSNDPDSAGSQFYFCLGEQAFLDSGYTVFANTIEGKDVVNNLTVGDVIETIEIV